MKAPIPAPRLRRCTGCHPMSGTRCSKLEHTNGSCELRDARGRVYGGWTWAGPFVVNDEAPQGAKENDGG